MADQLTVAAGNLRQMRLAEAARLTELHNQFVASKGKGTPLSAADLRSLDQTLKAIERDAEKSNSAKASEPVASPARLDPERCPVGAVAEWTGFTRKTIQLDLNAEPSLRSAGTTEGFLRFAAWLQWKLKRSRGGDELSGDGDGRERPKSWYEKRNLDEQRRMRRIKRGELQGQLISRQRFTDEVTGAFSATAAAIQRLALTLPGPLADLAVETFGKLIPSDRAGTLHDELAVLCRGRLTAELDRTLASLSDAIEQCQPPQVQSQQSTDGRAARSDGSPPSTSGPARASARRSRRRSARGRNRNARPGRKRTSRSRPTKAPGGPASST